jgi:HEAT repeat protein
VRAQSAQSLGARASRHTHKGYAAGVLARCLGDADPAVCESAAKGLSELAEPRAIPFLIDALERNSARGDVSALRATQASLRALSGEKRDRSAEEWRRWWREEGERALVH